MKNKGFVLICDFESENLNQISSGLDNEGYSVEVVTDASELIPRAIRARPGVLIVNPDMPAFNEADVCKNLIKDMDLPVIILIEKNSTTRAQIHECEVEDVITKPVDLNNLIFLVNKNLTLA